MVVLCSKNEVRVEEGALREAVEALRECPSRDGDLEEGGWGRRGGRTTQARRGRLQAALEGAGGTPRRRWRLPGRGGAGPGQEEVSAPGHPPRGGFPESSRRERAPALRPGAGKTGRKKEAARAEPQECTVGP